MAIQLKHSKIIAIVIIISALDELSQFSMNAGKTSVYSLMFAHKCVFKLLLKIDGCLYVYIISLHFVLIHLRKTILKRIFKFVSELYNKSISFRRQNIENMFIL